MRVQLVLDELPGVGDRLRRDLQLVGDSGELVLAELGQELADDVARERLAEPALVEVIDLNQQALAQIARADADRLLRLQDAQHRPHVVDV